MKREQSVFRTHCSHHSSRDNSSRQSHNSLLICSPESNPLQKAPLCHEMLRKRKDKNHERKVILEPSLQFGYHHVQQIVRKKRNVFGRKSTNFAAKNKVKVKEQKTSSNRTCLQEVHSDLKFFQTERMQGLLPQQLRFQHFPSPKGSSNI